jgi:hypothetical protein
MQKRWLKDFEFNINPATWNAAQDILQAGKVKNLREVERHFWVALVEDEEASYETEIMITPHKIKAFTCECFTEGRRLMCAHVAASLFKVRQFLEQRAEAKSQQAAQKQTHELSRLTVQTALENSTFESLLEFVREYARRDRDFSLALKTWFAGSITDSVNPYALVLESVIPKSLQSKQFREPDYRRLRHTIDDLNTQYQQALGHQNYRTAFLISSAILQKTLPLLQKNEENKREQFVFFGRQALQHLTALQPEALSPELRLLIRELLFDLGMQNLYPAEMLRESVQAVSETISDEAEFARVRDQYNLAAHPAPAFLLQLYLVSLAKRKFPEAVVRVLSDYSTQPAIIRDAILQLYYLSYWEAVVPCIEAFIAQKVFSNAHRRELEDLLFLIAEKTGDVGRQTRILRERFLTTGQFDYFTRLKAAASAHWPDEKATLIGELQQKNDLKNLAAVLAAEGERTALATLLAETSDIYFLQRYEDLFLTDNKNFIRDRYIDLLTEYLREHFGRQASTQVKQHLTNLIQKGEPTLVGEIIRQLTARYEERHTLPEELAEMFPKTKRKAMTGIV